MRLALLGWPLGHSVSPAMQGAAMAACGLFGSYEPLEALPEQLGAAVARLRADTPDGPRLDGANVTVPHKEAVLAWVDAVAPSAARIGAANTLVVAATAAGGRRVVAHNTDADGLLAAWDEHFGLATLNAAHVVMLGAGGAARAAAVAVASAGARRLSILNRDPQRAEALASHLAQLFPALSLDVAPLACFATWIETADACIQCTSLGTAGGQKALPGRWPATLSASARSRLRVMDLVYNPERTRFLAGFPGPAAHAAGGLSLLVHQGAAAFRLWTELEPPVDAMRQAAHLALLASRPRHRSHGSPG